MKKKADVVNARLPASQLVRLPVQLEIRAVKMKNNYLLR